MVEEGANPILEGGIVIAANLQDMLLQDYILPHIYHDAVLLKVFPAVPVRWGDAAFFRLRCLNGCVVSAVRAAESTALVEVLSEQSGQAVVLDVHYTSPPVLTTSAPAGAVKVTLVGVNRHRIVGLPAGAAAVLHLVSSTDFAVRPLPGNQTEHNYYGFKTSPAETS